MSAIPPSVFELVDRVAAAFLRNDTSAARRIVDDYRIQWEHDGAREERRVREEMVEQTMEFERSGDAWFQSADGLMCLDKIRDMRGYYSPIWKRPCRPLASFLIRGEPPSHSAIEVRVYERQGECHRDGRPIYRETFR